MAPHAQHPIEHDPERCEELRREQEQDDRANDTQMPSRLDDPKQGPRDLLLIDGDVLGKRVLDLAGHRLWRQDESRRGDHQKKERDEAYQEVESQASGKEESFVLDKATQDIAQ